MKEHKILIGGIVSGSIADEFGIEKGDKLLRINGKCIDDILEYKFLISDEILTVEVEKQNEEIWELDIEKDYDEDLGFIFDGIIDKQKSCSNKCIFCFIDQLPKGMRKTLYFKDDDTRLSFLMGNFVTLTNLNNEDIEKIIRYRISPINISIHTTDMELRKEMLNNKNAKKLMEYLDRLKSGKIEMKGQIVLCPEINDGTKLAETLKDLISYYPELNCVAVVPVGLTKYRKGLYSLKEYDMSGALKVIKQVEKKQEEFLTAIGTRFVFLSDEFYILAGKDLPSHEHYEDFSQLENGVGIIRLFRDNINMTLQQLQCLKNTKANAAIITGEYAFPIMKDTADCIMKKLSCVSLEVLGITNEFFGTSVKVAGLITGKDVISQLKNRNYIKNVLIPDNMLKADENIFLDDITIEDIEKSLGIRIIVCKQDGSDLIKNILEKC
ncbi:MAG: DUF512 domain-containing protein [Clostridiales bacterium]|nr:DUF512 domain-containing protein [Clostridiales bacterium]